MNLDKAKNTLRAIKPKLLEKYPIATIGLFGSIVRDDFSENSDIDIIVDFNGRIGIGFIDLADELERELGWKVDLASRGGIKQRYLEVIDPEIIYI